MAITINKPTVDGSENTWGTILNGTLDNIGNALNSAAVEIAPDLTVGSWKIGGTAVTATAAELNILDGVSATMTAAELNYVEGATSSIQTQLDAKEDVDAEILRADTDDNVTAGYTATADNDGEQSSGTYTPDPAGGNLKRITNGGSFTLAAPTAAGDYTMVIQMTNTAAGTVSTSGFNKVSGNSITTTIGDDFFLFITKINGFTSLTVQALQ